MAGHAAHAEVNAADHVEARLVIIEGHARRVNALAVALSHIAREDDAIVVILQRLIG